MVYHGGFGILIGKVEAIIPMPRPCDVSRLRAFLGICNYYKKFVMSFSVIVKAFTILIKNDQPWV